MSFLRLRRLASLVLGRFLGPPPRPKGFVSKKTIARAATRISLDEQRVYGTEWKILNPPNPTVQRILTGKGKDWQLPQGGSHEGVWSVLLLDSPKAKS